MFCPNCSTENRIGLNYCRNCGLKLERIVEAVAEQLPPNQDTELLLRKRKFERAGRGAFVVYGVMSLALIVFFVTQYQALGYYFGAALFGAIVLMVWLFLTAAGIYNFPKLFLKSRNLPQAEEVPPSPGATAGLIEDRPFEPAVPSVTESTTELLKVPRAKN